MSKVPPTNASSPSKKRPHPTGFVHPIHGGAPPPQFPYGMIPPGVPPIIPGVPPPGVISGMPGAMPPYTVPPPFVGRGRGAAPPMMYPPPVMPIVPGAAVPPYHASAAAAATTAGTKGSTPTPTTSITTTAGEKNKIIAESPAFVKEKAAAIGAATSPSAITSSTPSNTTQTPSVSATESDAKLWTAHRTAEGLVYYYNTRTKVSTWSRPPGFVEPTVASSTAAAGGDDAKKDGGKKDKKKKKEKKIAGRVSIPDTPWELVRTKDGKQFFYNSQTKSSVWEMPAELEGKQLPEFPTEHEKSHKQQQQQPETTEATTTAEEATAAATEANTAVAEEAKPQHDAQIKPMTIINEGEDEDEEGFEVIETGEEVTTSTATTGAATAAAGGGEEEELEFEIPNDDDDLDFEVFDPDAGTTVSVDEMQKRLEGELGKQEGEGDESPSRKKARTEEEQEEEEGPQEEQRDEEGYTISERVEIFTQMLIDKKISPFSAWKDVLPKIVFEPRYKILKTMEQRQAAFEIYKKKRPTEEVKQKAAKKKAAKEEFKELLDEAKLTHDTTYAQFSRKYDRDRRFRNLDAKPREAMFNERIEQLRKKYRDEKAELTKAFRDLLREMDADHSIDWKSWSNTLRTMEEDDRYRTKAAALSSNILDLKEREQIFRNIAEDKEEEERKRARIEQEHRKKREAAEQEAEMALRKQKLHEAVTAFQSLLAERIFYHNADSKTWPEWRETLKNDPRYGGGESATTTEYLLSEDDRKDLFERHKEMLKEKERDKFRAMLAERESLIHIDSKWDDSFRELFGEDPRYKRIPDDKEREQLFNEHVAKKLEDAKRSFHDLLVESERETVLLNPTTPTSGKKFEELKNLLKLDKRYSLLGAMPKLREKMLVDFIHALRAKRKE